MVSWCIIQYLVPCMLSWCTLEVITTLFCAPFSTFSWVFTHTHTHVHSSVYSDWCCFCCQTFISAAVLLCSDRAGCYGVSNVEQEGQRVNVVCFIWNAAQEGIASIKVCSCFDCEHWLCKNVSLVRRYSCLEGVFHCVTLYTLLSNPPHTHALYLYDFHMYTAASGLFCCWYPSYPAPSPSSLEPVCNGVSGMVLIVS